MIKPHSDDPDVAAAAQKAAEIVEGILDKLPKAETFDYGGHYMRLGEYGVCTRCTSPIAEAQQAEHALREAADHQEDEEVKSHILMAADYLRLESEAAIIRAELHNGQNSEKIINKLLAFTHDRAIHDSYDHSHHGGNS